MTHNVLVKHNFNHADHTRVRTQVHIVTRDVLVLGHRAEEKGQVVHGPSASKVCVCAFGPLLSSGASKSCKSVVYAGPFCALGIECFYLGHAGSTT